MALNDSSPVPIHWLALLAALLGGAFYSRVNGPADGSPTDKQEHSANKEEDVAPLGITISDRRRRLDQPLREHLDAWRHDGDNPDGLRLDDCDLSYLIMTVADPIDSEEGYRFDTQLDTLGNALAADSNDAWVVGPFYSPWQYYRDRIGAKPTLALEPNEHCYRREPGVLVYRRPHVNIAKSRRTVPTRHELLVVLLVGEQPTLGIQKPAFRLAVDQILRWELIRTADDIEAGKRTPELRRPLEIYVAGPAFTGSAAGLAESIRDCRSAIPQDSPQQLNFTVITGSAAGADERSFRERASADRKPAVRFGSTIIKGDRMTAALLEFLESRNRPLKKNLRGAWLVESGTAFGASHRSANSHQQSAIDITTFYYPLHISQVRNVYEQQRHQKDLQAPSIAPLPGTATPLPFNAADGTRDLPPMMTAPNTAVEVELLLGQILNTIDRGGYDFVAISATDARDPIFLADQIRDHCPQIEILLPYPDVLETHPRYRGSLAGALVADTYPLLTDAQAWCYPYPTQWPPDVQKPPTLAHPNHVAAGLHNAAVLLRALDRGTNHGDFSRSAAAFWPRRQSTEINVFGRLPLWCYGVPGDTGPKFQPATWISVVGADAVWPVTVMDNDLYKDDYTIVVHDRSSVATHLTRPENIEFSSPYLPLLALIAVTCGAIVVYCMWFHTGDRTLPLRLPVLPHGQFIGPREFNAFLLMTLGTILLLCASLGTSAQYLRAVGDPTVTDLWHVFVYWLHRSLVVAGVVLAVAVLVVYETSLFHVRARLWRHLAGLLGFIPLVICFRAPDQDYPFQALTLAALLNGVSPILSLVLASAAISVLGYTIARQHYLLRTCRGLIPADEETHSKLAGLDTPWVSPRAPRSLSWHDIEVSFRSIRKPVMGLIAVTVLVVLSWILIGLTTVNKGIDLGRSILLFTVLVGASVCWWWLLVESWFVGKQLLHVLDESHKQWLRYAKPSWKPVFKELGRDSGRDITRLFYGNRPRGGDRASELMRLYVVGSDEMNALITYRVAHIGARQLRLLVYGLGTAAILIFLAAVGYPFNTAPAIRFMMAAMLAALGLVFAVLYVRLDRHPLLSRMLGSTPFSISWNWTTAYNGILFGGTIALAVISQMFPGLWAWLWSVVQSVVGVTG